MLQLAFLSWNIKFPTSRYYRTHHKIFVLKSVTGSLRFIHIFSKVALFAALKFPNKTEVTSWKDALIMVLKLCHSRFRIFNFNPLEKRHEAAFSPNKISLCLPELLGTKKVATIHTSGLRCFFTPSCLSSFEPSRWRRAAGLKSKDKLSDVRQKAIRGKITVLVTVPTLMWKFLWLTFSGRFSYFYVALSRWEKFYLQRLLEVPFFKIKVYFKS